MRENAAGDPGKPSAPVFSERAATTGAVLIGVFVAGRLWRLTSYSLRADEIFSFQVAQQSSWKGLLVAVIRDIVHPPLFYAMLSVWLHIGGASELWLRLLPVLTAIAALGPFFGLC